MNNPLLQVKLRFRNEKNPNRPNGRKLKAHAKTTIEKIDTLSGDLRAVLLYFRNTPKLLNNILVDVHYNDIIAKSNRIIQLLKPSGRTTNDQVVGARFSDAPNGLENHIITYYVDEQTITKTLHELDVARSFLCEKLDGVATPENFNELNSDIYYKEYGLARSTIRNIIVDCSVLESFSVPNLSVAPEKDSMLITFYKTELPVATLLQKLGVDDIRYSFYGNDTISATRDLCELLIEQVPYLISMISSDLSKISLDDNKSETQNNDVPSIPAPGSEPVIGVIDTLCSEQVYFSDWVENVDYIDEYEKLMQRTDNREHGTQVTSIIVDGPALNPWLDDGCGRFRVKHFGVCADKISTLRLVKKIKEIVSRNPEIHVWNLSLGTEDEVSRNFISFDASVLDDIQAQRNVVFVVSGTNDNRPQHTEVLRVGSPADSLNALVVNSVRRNGAPASYSRKGAILSFFNKPDVSYYGGDYDERIIAYSPSHGKEEVYGTSFAAPWISRKLCYLIDVMGLSREVAKALIIDSAAGWEYKTSGYLQQEIMGYGIVPIDIHDVLESKREEIRFVVYGTSESYRTVNYAIPIPKDDNDHYPFIARATLCYFPECSRSQGVDYTSRELSLQFGRINDKGYISDINDNVQDQSGSHVDERQSRKDFRKWENTKFISKIEGRNRPLQSYEDRLWGISITSKERLTSRTGSRLNFGVVITLKEIKGINRIQDFVRACTLRGWIVNELNIQNQIEIYNNNQEEIDFE